MILTYHFTSAWLTARIRNDRAASLVEYALLVSLIAVVCVLAVTQLGRKANSKFSSISGAL